MNRLIITSILIGSALLAQPALAEGGWTFGLGTGLSALDIDGDAGFNTRAVGPVDFEMDLNSDEIRDYMDTGYGFAVVAKKDKLTISSSLSNMELEGGGARTISAGNQGRAEVEFDSQGAEITADYTFAQSNKHAFGGIAGIRYQSQEYGLTLTVNGERIFKGSVDDEWTDALIGVSHAYAISPTLSWSSKLVYGFGGSEGTTQFNTGVSKIFKASWLVRLGLTLKDVEYEDGNRGSADWFFYDATETSVGLSFLYLF